MSIEKASSDDSRNRIVLGVVVVVAVLLLIGLSVFIYNKQKVGKSGNPSAQRAALTLLDTIPVKGRAPSVGYTRDQFGQPWTDQVDGVEFGRNGCDTRDDILRRDLSNVVPPVAARSSQGYCTTRTPAGTSSSIGTKVLMCSCRSITSCRC
jgi:hypothetical protein